MRRNTWPEEHRVGPLALPPPLTCTSKHPSSRAMQVAVRRAPSTTSRSPTLSPYRRVLARMGTSDPSSRKTPSVPRTTMKMPLWGGEEGRGEEGNVGSIVQEDTQRASYYDENAVTVRIEEGEGGGGSVWGMMASREMLRKPRTPSKMPLRCCCNERGHPPPQCCEEGQRLPVGRVCVDMRAPPSVYCTNWARPTCRRGPRL